MCGEEVALQGILRGEGDGVDDPVEFPQRSARSSATASMSSGLFTSSSRMGGSGSRRLAVRSVRLGAAEAAKDDLRPLLLGQPGRRVGYRAPVQDTGNQYLLAFEQPPIAPPDLLPPQGPAQSRE